MIYSSHSYSHYQGNGYPKHYDPMPTILGDKLGVLSRQLQQIVSDNENQAKQIKSLEDKLSNALEKLDYLCLSPEEKENKKISDKADNVINNLLQCEIWDFCHVFLPELLDDQFLIRLLNVYNFYNTRHYLIGELMKSATGQPFTNEIIEYTDKEILRNLTKLKRCGTKTAQFGMKIWRKAEELLNEQKQILKNIESKKLT